MRYLVLTIFLSVLFAACNKETATSPSSATTTPVAVKQIPIKPIEMYAWVDQLRVRALPTLKSRVIVEMVEGDTLQYMHEATVRNTRLNLRGKDFNRPWIKVKTNDGKTGWVYGGGVTNKK